MSHRMLCHHQEDVRV